jgi:hypothetical protein
MSQPQGKDDPLEGWWRQGDAAPPPKAPTDNPVLSKLEDTLETLSEEVAQAQKLVSELAQESATAVGTPGTPKTA